MRIPLAAGIAITAICSTLAAAESPTSQDARRTPVVRVFEKCRDAVVNISTTRVIRMRSIGWGSLDDIFDFGGPRPGDRRIESVGSGVVIHESGYIVTNAHVVAQASDVHVTFADKRTLPAKVVAVDREHDLAVLKVDTLEPLACQKLGRSDDLMVGETVVAIGNPMGLQHTVTTGIVSALERDLQFTDEIAYRGLIQTDAPINPGNSGGPLLNIEGALIGINTAIRGDAQNIGFAIPVDRVWELLPSLLDIERRERVRFGLQVNGQDAKVTEIRQDSPAAKTDLKPGDHITAFDGQPVHDGIDFYVHLLGHRPDSEVKLIAQRGQQRVEASIPLTSIPIPDGAALASKLLGAKLVELTPEQRRRAELPDYVGLMAESVDRAGPADRVGIIPSDLILRLDGVPVSSLKDVGLALEQTRAGQRIVADGLRVDTNRPFFWTATLRARTK